MSRTYILDTNVLIHDPKSMFVFEEHQVVIPILVIEELDKFKSAQDERGFNARTTSRYLNKLSTLAAEGKRSGSLKEGVSLEGGGTLRVAWDGLLDSEGPRHTDHAILLMAKTMTEEAPEGSEVILVSRDTNVRVKGEALGIRVQDYRHDSISNPDKQFSGAREIEDATPVELRTLAEEGFLQSDLAPLDMVLNEFALVTNQSGKSIPTRWDGEVLKVVHPHPQTWGIAAKNKEQLYALDLLLDPRIELVTLTGSAGTGKTLLALAAGLSQVTDMKMYRKLLVSRPVIPMGKDIGFLPGTMEEKLNPWMQPIFDNLEMLISGGKTRAKKEKDPAGYRPWQYLLDTGLMEVEALTYIRGRSIPGQFLIVDEAQNLTPHEVKTILTRAGEGTKVILTGDPAQIDNPYVDSRSNGLSYTIEKFKGSARAGHVTLVKGERSGLAAEAASIL